MILFSAHSGIRYLVLLAGVITLVYAIHGAVTGRAYSREIRIFSSVFAGSLHLQVLLGFAVLFTRPFYPQLTGHIFMMMFAAIVAQLPPSVMRRRPAEARTFMPHVVGTIVALLLIAGGIMALGRPILGSTLG